ncbi:hypothetical protein HPP92_000024 [Vanilla planifolia]|uniref:Uncharacterized protein n=1 Tax=Vanilla planifolia TaxID=51239 RepID=A0A835S0I0_VANPL|nr:hypothetical protein HPP92_000024 [Vanilla planifolia]
MESLVPVINFLRRSGDSRRQELEELKELEKELKELEELEEKELNEEELEKE